MPVLTKISRLVASAAFIAVGSLSATAQETILRLHHFLPPTASTHLTVIQPWCDKIAMDSGGKLKCQIYPAMQLGGAPGQLLDQARDGVVDMVWTLPTYSAGRFTKSEVFELPWMTYSAKGASQALWTFVERHAQDEFKGVKRIFMHVHDGVTLHFASKRPKTLEDLKGLKIRAASRAHARMLSALGAAPVQMPLPQTPEALSKGVVDGIAAPWEAAPAIKLSEIAKFHLDAPDTEPRMSNSIFILAMNLDKYQSLPADLKKVIDDNSGLEASAWAGENGYDIPGAIYKRQAAATDSAIFYTLTPAETQRWRQASALAEREWDNEVAAKGFNPIKLREEAIALIKQYSQQ